jgi:hypothetical protein
MFQSHPSTTGRNDAPLKMKALRSQKQKSARLTASRSFNLTFDFCVYFVSLKPRVSKLSLDLLK